jgi:hypothetical protein
MEVILHDIVDTVYGNIYLYGSWDNWTKAIPVDECNLRCRCLVYARVKLDHGSYQYKFADRYCKSETIWFHNVNKASTITPEGYINNVIDVGNHMTANPYRGYCGYCGYCDSKAEIINHTRGEIMCVSCLIHIDDHSDDIVTDIPAS